MLCCFRKHARICVYGRRRVFSLILSTHFFPPPIYLLLLLLLLFFPLKMAGAPFKKNISFTRALSKLLHLYFTKCLIIIQNGRLHYSPPTCQSDNKSQRERFFFRVYLQHGVVIASIGKISSYNLGFFFSFWLNLHTQTVCFCFISLR